MFLELIDYANIYHNLRNAVNSLHIMIDDNLKEPSPAAERGCRLTALMESGGIAKVDLNEKHQNFARQKRLNVRRLKKLSENFRFYAADYRYYKRKKPENNSVTDGVITVDQVQLGTTSSEVKTVRESLQRVTCGSHGLISLIGRRREMEDAVTVKPGLLSKGNRKYDFFGVYDGHGGSRAAHACREWLHRLVIEEIVEEEEDDESINWEKVMRESFVKMDEEVEKKGAEMATMGSTAVVAMVSEEEVIVANCGDSRAVLSRGGVTVPLSIDHKVSNKTLDSSIFSTQLPHALTIWNNSILRNSKFVKS